MIEAPLHGSLTAGIQYTPADHFFGLDSFTYQLSNGETSNTVTVNLTIENINDAPVTQDDSFSVNSSSTVLNLLTNDADIVDEHSSVTIQIETQPTHGTLTYNRSQLTRGTQSLIVLLIKLKMAKILQATPAMSALK